MLQKRDDELRNKNIDTTALKDCEAEIATVQRKLDDIENHREFVARYRYDKQELFDHEDEFKSEKQNVEDKLSDLQQKFNARKVRLDAKKAEQEKTLQQHRDREKTLQQSIEETDKFATSSICPENLRDLGESPNARLCTEILSELKESLITSQKRGKDLEVA